jgi:hypothetical protein
MHEMVEKKVKRKRGARVSFGELVRKLWETESVALEPAAGHGKAKGQPEKAGAFERVSCC